MKAIRLKFRGEEFLIPATQAFEIGAQVEDIVTLGEIASWGAKVPFFKVARCFGAMLRFAGCKATDAEVFQDMMDSIAKFGRANKGGAADVMDVPALAAVSALTSCLMGGAPLTEEAEETPEKPSAS